MFDFKMENYFHFKRFFDPHLNSNYLNQLFPFVNNIDEVMTWLIAMEYMFNIVADGHAGIVVTIIPSLFIFYKHTQISFCRCMHEPPGFEFESLTL